MFCILSGVTIDYVTVGRRSIAPAGETADGQSPRSLLPKGVKQMSCLFCRSHVFSRDIAIASSRNLSLRNHSNTSRIAVLFLSVSLSL